jgi:hypothetical protein
MKTKSKNNKSKNNYCEIIDKWWRDGIPPKYQI